jgi:hypothetical protein
MKSKSIPAVVIVVLSLSVSAVALFGGGAISAQDRVQAVSISQSEKLMAVILADPVMVKAYQSGIPGNGKPFPDGSRMAKSGDVSDRDGPGNPA